MRRLAAALALLLAFAAPAAAGDERDAAIVARTIDGFIRPATARFAVHGRRLSDAVAGFCAAPGPEARAAVDGAFKDAVTGWSGIQFLRFGPLVESHRLERIAFWPDPKGIALRQIRKAVAERDASVTDPARIAGKSVALQGLTAIEYLLFADGDPAGPFRCGFAAAAAASLADTVSEIAREWADPQGFSRRLLAPGADDPLYRTPSEALAELHRALSTGLQVTQEQKLKPVLGSDPDSARPFLAPFRRSGFSLDVLAADAAALMAFTEAGGFTRDLPEDFRWLDNSIAFEFRNAVKAAEAVPVPIDEAVYDAAARGRLEYLALVLGDLRSMVQQQLAAALGLTVGFNALDGD